MKFTFLAQADTKIRQVVFDVPQQGKFVLYIEMHRQGDADLFIRKFESFQMAASAGGDLTSDFNATLNGDTVSFSGNLNNVMKIIAIRKLIPSAITQQVNKVLELGMIPEYRHLITIVCTVTSGIDSGYADLPAEARNIYLDLLLGKIETLKTLLSTAANSTQPEHLSANPHSFTFLT